MAKIEDRDPRIVEAEREDRELRAGLTDETAPDHVLRVVGTYLARHVRPGSREWDIEACVIAVVQAKTTMENEGEHHPLTKAWSTYLKDVSERAYEHIFRRTLDSL